LGILFLLSTYTTTSRRRRAMTELRQRMIRDMQLKGLDPDTQKAYVAGVKGIVGYYGVSPDQLGEEQIRDYLHYLITERELSQSYVSQVYSGLKCLFESTLKRDWVKWGIPRAKKVKKLPVVLSVEEVRRLIDRTRNVKHRTLLEVIYSGGLRLREAVGLKPTDIDSDRMAVSRTETGHSVERTDGAKGLRPGLSAGRYPEGGDTPLAPAQLCHAPVGQRRRHHLCPAVAGAQEPSDYLDLPSRYHP
jgi:integrase